MRKIVIVVVFFLSGCGKADDLGRAAVMVVERNAAAKAEQNWKAIMKSSANRTESSLSRRLQRLAKETARTDEALSAVSSLTWHVVCDAAGDSIPRDARKREEWIVARALVFGLEFTSDGAKGYGNRVLEEKDRSTSDVTKLCLAARPVLTIAAESVSQQ